MNNSVVIQQHALLEEAEIEHWVVEANQMMMMVGSSYAMYGEKEYQVDDETLQVMAVLALAAVGKLVDIVKLTAPC